MSLIGDALAPYALISSPVRSISTIIPDVVIDEVHTDDLAITDHPVETGADLLKPFAYLGFGGRLFVVDVADPASPPGFNDLGTNARLYFEAAR